MSTEIERTGRCGAAGRAEGGDAANFLPDAQFRLSDHGLDPDAQRRRIARQVLDIDVAQSHALTGGLQLDLLDDADEQGALDRRRQHAPIELRGPHGARQEARRDCRHQNGGGEYRVTSTQQPASPDADREGSAADPDRWLHRQGKVAGDTGAERNRQPDRPETALIREQGFNPLAQLSPQIQAHAIAVSDN